MAGVPGFEPGNADTKNRCLTTWRHPNEGAEIATLAVAGNTRSHPLQWICAGNGTIRQIFTRADMLAFTFYR